MAVDSGGRRLTASALRDLLGTWRTTGSPRRLASYRELANRVELLVVDGRIPPGSRLPAERELATALALSRTTVAGAYGELHGRGMLLTIRGSGSIVTLPASTTVPTGHMPAAAADLSHAILPGWEGLPRHLTTAAERLPFFSRRTRSTSTASRSYEDRSPNGSPPAACRPRPARSSSPSALSTHSD